MGEVLLYPLQQAGVAGVSTKIPKNDPGLLRPTVGNAIGITTTISARWPLPGAVSSGDRHAALLSIYPRDWKSTINPFDGARSTAAADQTNAGKTYEGIKLQKGDNNC